MELPCDKFSNKITFRIWSASTNILVRLFSAISLVIFLLIFCVHDVLLKVLFSSLYLYFQAMTIVLAIFFTNISKLESRMSPENKMKFYAEIVNNQPYSEPKSWNIICYNMNAYFEEIGSQNLLFDGADCYNLFQLLLDDGKDKQQDKAKLLGSNSPINSSSTKPYLQPPEISDKSTVDKSNLLYLDTAKEKANLVFLKAENDYWVQKYPELAA